MSALGLAYGSDSEEDISDEEAGGLVSYSADEDDESASPSSSKKLKTKHHSEGASKASDKPTSDFDGKGVPCKNGNGADVSKAGSQTTVVKKNAVAVLPPRPTGTIDINVQKKVAYLIEHQAKGMDINEHVKRNKMFQNPSIYKKLIETMDIDETASNCLLHKYDYDPKRWKPCDYADKLAEARAAQEQKRLEERKKRTEVQFVKSTVRSVLPSATAASTGAGVNPKNLLADAQRRAADVQRRVALGQKPPRK